MIADQRSTRMSHGRHRLRDEENPREENGTCLEKHLEISLKRSLEISLGSTVCVRSPALLAAGLCLPGLAAGQSKEYPTYVTGPQKNGSWVVSDGQVITPAGTQVDLGIRVRAKAIALNPSRQESHRRCPHPGRVGGRRGVRHQHRRCPAGLRSRSDRIRAAAIAASAYSADGKYLVFSQDSSNVTIAKVNPQGLLEDDAQVSVPPNNSFITCFPNSPIGDYGRPCGTFYTPSTSYPGGVALSKDGKSAYALLNQNDTLTQIDLTAKPPSRVRRSASATRRTAS